MLLGICVVHVSFARAGFHKQWWPSSPPTNCTGASKWPMSLCWTNIWLQQVCISTVIIYFKCSWASTGAAQAAGEVQKDICVSEEKKKEEEEDSSLNTDVRQTGATCGYGGTKATRHIVAIKTLWISVFDPNVLWQYALVPFGAISQPGLWERLQCTDLQKHVYIQIHTRT